MSDYRDLKVWQAAQELAVDVLKACDRSRWGHHRSLREQILRSAASVPANIAEGSAYRTSGDFARFLQYAIGSSSELESHLDLASAMALISRRDALKLISRVSVVRSMLYRLRDSL